MAYQEYVDANFLRLSAHMAHLWHKTRCVDVATNILNLRATLQLHFPTHHQIRYAANELNHRCTRSLVKHMSEDKIDKAIEDFVTAMSEAGVEVKAAKLKQKSLFQRAISELVATLEEGAKSFRLRLGKEKAPDGEWKPVVHMLMPDGADHPFRSKLCMLMPGDGGEPEPQDDASHIVRALLINGYGEPVYDADTDQPAIIDVPAALIRFNDERMMSQKEVAKMADVDRSTVYRAVRAGHLTEHKLEGKHARFLKEQVKEWIRGETVAKTKKKKRY